MTRLLAFASLALVVALSPAAPVPEAAKKPVFFYPTKVGARNEYRVNDQDSSSLLVTGVEEKDGSWLVTQQPARVGSEVTAPSLSLVAAVSPAGVALVESVGRRLDPPVVLLKLPVGDGVLWERVPNRAWGATTYAAREEDVTVPAGRFRSVRVDRVERPRPGVRGPAFASTSWYAAGVGVVKYVDQNHVKVLTSFTPGKANAGRSP